MLVVKTAVLIDIQNSKASNFSGPAANKKLWMNACNSFQDFRIRKFPILIGGMPIAARERFVDVRISMEQFKKLTDTDLPPFRKVVFSRKSSRRIRRWRARLNMSSNDRLFLNWDELT